ncbi:GNAT family N-acetyltransferase [Bacillus massiliigorillae]|uniref:GNAT family N-acetyltransferase n=1 Tax=Bacillus massiliigorillae TaxID=1243664 RepID=UPI00039FB179|nr:GNAT family N-acetyltransferase [Bacillus massiliigorillae]
MITPIDITQKEIASVVLSIQIPAYQVEAELLNVPALPPLQDTIESLQNCGETFYGYFINETLAGFISYKFEDHMLDIHRLAVHPTYFHEGIGKSLLHFIEEIEPSVDKIQVTTGTGNKPATTLYKQFGYQEVKQIKVSNQLSLTNFEKALT